MLKSIVLKSYSSPLLVEANDLHRTSATKRAVQLPLTSSSNSSTTNSHGNVPKLEPFSRTKLERVVKDPPLIQKAENEIADYCSTLEGEDSYSCWRAYFELKQLEKESPKQDLEKLILQAGGLKSLIGCLHGISSMFHPNNRPFAFGPSYSTAMEDQSRSSSNARPIPDGLPKTEKELEEEESGRMPDSPFTRLLRAKGRFPAWYSPAPDY